MSRTSNRFTRTARTRGSSGVSESNCREAGDNECRNHSPADPLIKREPVLVVEVLSPGTAAYDRGDKFAAYRLVPSLHELLLIDPDSRRCDLYRKGTDGLWVLHPFEPGQAVQLQSVSMDLTAQALWDEVDPPAG